MQSCPVRAEWAGNLVYLATLAGVIAATEVLRAAGVSAIVPFLTVVPAAALIVAIAERLLAFVPQPPGVHVDALSFGVNLAVPAAWNVGLAVITVGLAALWPGVGRLWPAALPHLVQLALAFLLAELGIYWMHRGIHASRLLFRFHAMHHSAPAIYWLNASRFHPIDLLLLHAAGVTPMLILGAGPEVVAAYGVVSQTGAFLQHANLRVRGGLLSWIFHLPELHRWHHAADRAEGDSNFGGTLIVWDVLFGTRRLPRDREAEVGLGRPFPTCYLGQLAAPFRRQEELR